MYESVYFIEISVSWIAAGFDVTTGNRDFLIHTELVLVTANYYWKLLESGICNQLEKKWVAVTKIPSALRWFPKLWTESQWCFSSHCSQDYTVAIMKRALYCKQYSTHGEQQTHNVEYNCIV